MQPSGRRATAVLLFVSAAGNQHRPLEPLPQLETMPLAVKGFGSGCRAARAAPRRPLRVRAEEDKSKISFKPNENAALGFTEDDSAGQSNIFAVEPKQYVAGSASDRSDSSGTLVVGGVAAAVAAGVLVFGLTALNGDSQSSTASPAPVVFEDAGTYKPLSYYAQALQSAPALE